MRCSTALVIAAVGVSLSSGSASAAPRAPCSSPGRLVQATPTSAVTLRNGIVRGLVGYFACAKGARARYLDYDRGSQTWGGIVKRPSLTAAFVGFAVQVCDKGGCFGYVRSVALRSGKVVRARVPGEEDEGRRVVDAQIAKDGTVFWVATVPGGAEIHRLSRDGAQTTLDTGAIDPESLTVGRTAAYWTKADQPQLARLR